MLFLTFSKRLMPMSNIVVPTKNKNKQRAKTTPEKYVPDPAFVAAWRGVEEVVEYQKHQAIIERGLKRVVEIGKRLDVLEGRIEPTPALTALFLPLGKSLR